MIKLSKQNILLECDRLSNSMNARTVSLVGGWSCDGDNELIYDILGLKIGDIVIDGEIHFVRRFQNRQSTEGEEYSDYEDLWHEYYLTVYKGDELIEFELI